MKALIIRLWCQRFHGWKGWEVTSMPVNGYGVSSMRTGEWTRDPCRFCRGVEMPRPPRNATWRDGRVTTS